MGNHTGLPKRRKQTGNTNVPLCNGDYDFPVENGFISSLRSFISKCRFILENLYITVGAFSISSKISRSYVSAEKNVKQRKSPKPPKQLPIGKKSGKCVLHVEALLWMSRTRPYACGSCPSFTDIRRAMKCVSDLDPLPVHKLRAFACCMF